MFVVTDNAKQELDAFFADKDQASVRIYMASGGWSGPRLALALDEPRDTDKVFDELGFKFCMDSDLYSKAQDVTVDAGYMGFVVESSQPLASGDGGCSGCNGGCGS